MLRNLIEGKHTTEIFKINSAVKRGAVVTKDYANKYAVPASGVGVEVFFVDKDFQPTGYLSDSEVSEYTTEADTVVAGDYAVLVKAQVGETWATDQVVATGLTAGDYAIAGTTTNVGLLIKATTSNVSCLRYAGTYDDAGHTLYMFDVVMPKTV